MKYLFFVLVSLFLTKIATAASDPSQYTRGDEPYGGTGTAAGADPAAGAIAGTIDSSIAGNQAARAPAASATPLTMCLGSGTEPADCLCVTDPKYSAQDIQGVCLRAAKHPDVKRVSASVTATNAFVRRFGGGGASSGAGATATSAAPASGPGFVESLAMQIATELLSGPQASQAGGAPPMDLLTQMLLQGGQSGQAPPAPQGDPFAGY